MHRRACPNSNVSFVEFMDRRQVIAIKPEELAVREIQESSHQVSNFNVELDLELSPTWKRVLERAGCAESNLTINADSLAQTGCVVSSSGQTLEYLKQLPVRVSLVFEYSNYSLEVAADGRTARVLNRLPAVGPSGFEFRQAKQKMITTKFIEIGK